MRSKHTPAALRKTGIQAYINYLAGAILVFFYYFIVSRTIWYDLPFHWWNFKGVSGFLEKLLEGGDLLQFTLLLCMVSPLVLWLLFSSKIAAFHIELFRGIQWLVFPLAFVYIIAYWYFEWGNPTNKESQWIGYGTLGFLPLFIAVGIFEKKPKVLKWIMPLLVFYTISYFGMLQILDASPFFWKIFWMVIVPLGILYYKNIIMVCKEYLKELPLYRRLFILGKRGESARWASYYEFFKRDMGGWFFKNRRKIWWSDRSQIFYGLTFPEHDTRIGGRLIGSVSEGHHITIAGTRGGKSVYAIYNNLLSYAGGVIALDPKGELATVTYKRRSLVKPFHIIDPFGVYAQQTARWNPLDEINIHSPEAREQIKTLAEASLFMDKSETGNSAHFRENAQIILRGVIAYVMSDPFLNDAQRHLGTVFNLIKYGEAEGKRFSPLSLDSFIKTQLTTNKAANGAAMEAANILTSVGERERGALLSTIARGIDWMNAENIKKVICHSSDFSLRDAKTKESSIYLILPEEHLQKFSRFTSTFFTMAINLCGNHITPQPEGSKRRVLFLLDEFAKLGHFLPVAEKITIAAGSYLKFWIILQNIGQLTKIYNNFADFTGSSDIQVFSLKSTDRETPKFVHECLGRYTERTPEGEKSYSLMEESEIAEFLDPRNDTQIILPREGAPLMLKRVPFYKNYRKSQYDKNKY